MAKTITRTSAEYDYDITLSFAGEDREYVEAFAGVLRTKGIRVFYDKYEIADMWGKDLYSHLDDIYRNAAQYCVLFASKFYASRVWTNHERQSAQARAIAENEEYILPVRFDNTPIPGLRPTVHYIDLRKTSPEELARLTIEKLGKSVRRAFLPPEPDKLYKLLGIKAPSKKSLAFSQAYQFLGFLKRMTDEERLVVFNIFLLGCTGVCEMGDVHQ